MEPSLVTAAGIMFTKGFLDEYNRHVSRNVTELGGHTAKMGVKWKVQGPEVASSLIALVFDFGAEKNPLWMMFRDHMVRLKKLKNVPESKEAKQEQPSNYTGLDVDSPSSASLRDEHWKSVGTEPIHGLRFEWPQKPDSGSKFEGSEEATRYGLALWSEITTMVCSKIGDKNAIPYIHLTLAFLWSIAHVPGALLSFETFVPWTKLIIFLNTLGKSGVSDTRILSTMFPESMSGLGRQLPEDFPMRGLIWAQFYFLEDFFTGNVVDEDERTLEIPSHAAPRTERCLWLANRLVSLGRYMNYNASTGEFSPTDHVESLADKTHTFPYDEDQSVSLDQEFDAIMVNA